MDVGQARDRKVLLVDDDRDFADSLAAFLRLESYDVTIAYSFDRAREVVAQRPPHVALVDIRLGHENGIDLVREFHNRWPTLIAVMMTAYATVEVTVRALRAGAYDYLCKPFHTDDLLATLERCFERRHLHAERGVAVAALEDRNRELESLNARLTRVLSSVESLSRAEGPASAGQALLAVVMRELSADGGVVYLRECDQLTRTAVAGGPYAPMLTLPLPAGSWLADCFARPGPAARMASGSPPGLCSSNRTDCPGPTLALSLTDGTEMLGLVVVHAHASRGFTRQDADIAQILASFGAEVIRAARANDRLAQSERRLRDIVDNSPSAISLTDLEGRSVISNARFVEWFPHSVPGTASATNPNAPAELAGTSIIAGGQAATAEIEVAAEEGQLRRLLVTRFPVLDATRRPIGVGTIGTDVTERHLAEEKLRYAQRMEAVGQLTGGVAHDFNNLLAVVLGNLRLIEEANDDRPELLELIEDALDATRSGVELTGRLLAFGRLQPLHPEVTDVRDLVLTVSRLLGRTLGENITIQLTHAPDLWQVRIDRSQLEAALLNLAINARDAMPDGGQLRIAVRNTTLYSDDVGLDPEIQPGRFVVLSVSDDGVGMSRDIRQRAIQPFFTTKSAGKGSGLGLSMVYGFVKQSGGHLQINSESDHGTTIDLYFPALSAASPHAIVHGASTAYSPRGMEELILLVEDQPQVRLLLRRQLTRIGYRVLDVADAESALARLDDTPGIELLFADLVLPGAMGGPELCLAALANDPMLGVILTTGYAPDVERSGPLANAPVLRKPVDPETLARTVRAVIDRRTAGLQGFQSSKAESV